MRYTERWSPGPTSDTGTTQKAVIYCRVSSKAQTKRGDGLGSQETRAREYARMKGYEVVKVFTDDLTGRTTARPGMKAMLSFLRKHRKDNCAVIIDDISRLARNVQAHWDLRRTILEAGGQLQSPSIEFRQDADSRMVENVLAGAAQHQSEKNAEQTLNRMRARLMNGYWVFAKPIGYRYEKSKGQGNVLVRDEPLASILEEALHGFATGRFETKAEVARFLETFPEYPKDRNSTVHYQRVHDILTRPIYAGYIEHKPWNIPFMKGKHHDEHRLIDLRDYERIQDRLNGGAKVPARANINADFPLRGFILCGDCNNPLTACWSKSKTGTKHPYYLCHHKGCASYRKSIRRDLIENEFTDILASLKPSSKLLELSKAMWKQIWDFRLGSAASVAQAAKREVQAVQKQIDTLLDRLVDASTPSVIAAYENRIDKLEREKLILEERAEKSHKPQRGFDEMFELAMQFLSNPCRIWENGNLPEKHMVLKMAFLERIAYQRNEGFRTPETTLPFKVLGGSDTANFKMAHPRGFEPLASAFGGVVPI
ncbi:recombinase family protein [Kordiimonas sp.]|uniref:recombinase family protein n=1 Tax=Kordiimonas sp. TaxID=1970157 RepID=UPI003A8F5B70